LQKFPVPWEAGLKKEEKEFNCFMTKQETAAVKY